MALPLYFHLRMLTVCNRQSEEYCNEEVVVIFLWLISSVLIMLRSAF